MPNLSPFCTCQNFNCPLHPTRNDRGCAPCIQKNLRIRELPSCFFGQVDPTATRENDTYETFARLVLQAPEREHN